MAKKKSEIQKAIDKNIKKEKRKNLTSTFLGIGIGIAIACVGLFSYSTVHKQINKSKVPKVEKPKEGFEDEEYNEPGLLATPRPTAEIYGDAPTEPFESFKDDSEGVAVAVLYYITGDMYENMLKTKFNADMAQQYLLVENEYPYTELRGVDTVTECNYDFDTEIAYFILPDNSRWEFKVKLNDALSKIVDIEYIEK